MRTHTLSPLRYPGGKSKWAGELADYALADSPSSYASPFGGSGAVLLEIAQRNSEITLHYNDMDSRIAAIFAVAASPRTTMLDELARRIRATEPTVDLWRQMGPQNFPAGPERLRHVNLVDQAYAGLIRNRLSYSGIMNTSARVSGGVNQDGKTRISDRWYPETLVNRLRYMHDLLSGRTTVTSMDFARVPYADSMIVDPPYVRKANKLYAHWFKVEDHLRLGEWVRNSPGRWIVTYDHDPLIEQIYAGCKSFGKDMIYAITQGGGSGRVEKTELWITSH